MSAVVVGIATIALAFTVRVDTTIGSDLTATVDFFPAGTFGAISFQIASGLWTNSNAVTQFELFDILPLADHSAYDFMSNATRC